MDTVNPPKSEHGRHRLGWCDPGQARFWHRDEPSHRCPHTLGHIVCSCPHHDGVDPEEVNRRDREESEAREAALRAPQPKKKRRFKRKAWSR